MREELSLKAAILAEKFAPDLSWYETEEYDDMHLFLRTTCTSVGGEINEQAHERFL